MEYAENECVYCYQNGWQQPCNNEEHVCGHCVDELMRSGCTSQFVHVWRNFISSNCGNGTTCFLCDETRYLFFCVPCCDEHQNVYKCTDRDLVESESSEDISDSSYEKIQIEEFISDLDE
jgi:hypothetical protein